MSPFEALIDDLAALRDRRQIEANARAARHHAEAQRNRRMQQQQRPLKKAAPVDQPAPNFEAIAARQQQIAADLERSRVAAQQQAIRAHLATLAAAAKAGRLTAHQACLLDVYRGQALAMGLTP